MRPSALLGITDPGEALDFDCALAVVSEAKAAHLFQVATSGREIDGAGLIFSLLATRL